MLQNKKFIVVLAISIACVAFYNIKFFMKKEAAVYAEAEGEPSSMMEEAEEYDDVTAGSADMMASGGEYGNDRMEAPSMSGGLEGSTSGEVAKLPLHLNTLDHITLPSGAHFERAVLLLQGKGDRNPFLTGREHRQALMGGRRGRGGKGAPKYVTGNMIKMIYTVNGIGYVVVGGRHYQAGDSVGGEVIIAIKDESVTLSSGKRDREIFIVSRGRGHRGRGKNVEIQYQ